VKSAKATQKKELGTVQGSEGRLQGDSGIEVDFEG
jgi:hypothetical protein